MDELEEGVLRLCSGATPDDDAAWFGQRFAFAVGAFAEAFHVKLLQVLREGLHRVAVGDDGAVVPVEVVVVPGFQRRQPHGHVGHERRALEVFVHFVRAGKQFFVSAVAVLQDERQADGRPQREAAADPIPKRQDALGGDTEGGGFIDVGRQRNHLAVGFFAASGAQPFAHVARVGQGFFGTEALRGDDQQRRRRVEAAFQLADFHRVGRGEEVDADAVVGEVFEGGAEQARTEFGATDADVDDVRYRLTVIAFPLAAAHALADFFHAFAHGADVRADVFAVDDEGLVGGGAQAVVQRRAVFAGIDVVAAGDGGDALGDARFIHPLLPQRFGLRVDVVFGEIEVDAGVF